MAKNKYIPTIGSLYLNYIFQGIAAIIISQNMMILEERWGASVSQVTLIISAIGLGRVLSVNIAGLISDTLGRRKAVLIGVLSYIIFFLGLEFSTSVILAFIFAIFAGFGNAFLDTSTYPAVVESFEENHSSGSALSVLNKAFISIGQFVLPIATRYLLREDYYFGWTFLISAIFLAFNFVFLLKLPFPKRNNLASLHHQEKETEKKEKTAHRQLQMVSPARFRVEGVSLLIFSLISVSLFNIYIIWIPTFAESIIGMASEDSLVLVSFYSICSFISVFVTTTLVNKGLNILMHMEICTTVVAVSIFLMLFSPNLYTVVFATFCIGFFAAGGIWQLGLAVLLEFFPRHKGMVTSYYSLATSVAVMVTPYLTGLMAEYSINSVFIMIFLFALIGSCCVAIVGYRYRKVFSQQG